jgi:hypothetical protein
MTSPASFISSFLDATQAIVPEHYDIQTFVREPPSHFQIGLLVLRQRIRLPQIQESTKISEIIRWTHDARAMPGARIDVIEHVIQLQKNFFSPS